MGSRMGGGLKVRENLYRKKNWTSDNRKPSALGISIKLLEMSVAYTHHDAVHSSDDTHSGSDNRAAECERSTASTSISGEPNISTVKPEPTIPMAYVASAVKK